MDDYRREFLQSLLLVGFGSLLAGGMDLDDQDDMPVRSTSALGRVFLTESYDSLQHQKQRPDQYDIGITVRDGIFIGVDKSWVKIHDKNPQLESFVTRRATIGTRAGPTGEFGSRELVSQSDRTVRVPEDVDTIQAALDAVPLFNRHRYRVDIASGVYDEDIVVPAVVSVGMANTEDGRNAGVNLQGRGTVTVNSITVLNPVGCTAVGIEDFNPTQLNPYSDEQASVAVYGGQGQTYLKNITFDTAVDDKAQGIMAYGGAMVRADDCAFGSDNMRVGFHAKSQGRILAFRATGTVTDYPYSVSGGWISYANSEMSGYLDETETIMGMIYDGENKILHGVSDIVE